MSTDVSDTIEGLMPTLMEIFAGSDDTISFAPFGPEDVQAAQQETDYVNYVFNQKNPGFMVLYSFIKDALLSKMGVVKVWTESETRTEKETFYDQPDDTFALLADNKDLEIVAHSEHVTDYGTLHDVTVERKKDYKCHKVMAVPPEEFGISRTARNIKDATYCFHEVRRTQIDLIQDGYDEDQVRSLPDNSGEMQTNTESMARDSVDETQMGLGGTGANRATRWITTTEHHLWMDYEQNGKASLYRVMTGGPQGEILLRNGKLQIMEENHIPMAAMTPVIITHRLIGRSIADLVMDIQRIKTALMRALLDNTYMAVNPRPEVAEAFATEQTLDDLLVMRPGQPIRVKQPGGINWQSVPFVGEQILPVMQFMDTTREWRTGVNRQSAGRRSERAAEPGRDHRQPDAERVRSEGEADCTDIRRDRHQGLVRAAACRNPRERRSAADRAIAQYLDGDRSDAVERTRGHDHQCRARHRQQARGTCQAAVADRRADAGRAGRIGQPAEPLQQRQGTGEAERTQGLRNLFRRSEQAARSAEPGRQPQFRRRPIPTRARTRPTWPRTRPSCSSSRRRRRTTSSARPRRRNPKLPSPTRSSNSKSN